MKQRIKVFLRMKAQGLYDPWYEHDSCGAGFVVNIKGNPSHQIVEHGLEVLLNLAHRGACGSEHNSGDGAGVLIQVPHKFLKKISAEQGLSLPEPGQYGVGMLFLPREAELREKCEQIIAQTIQDEGQQLLGWRDVPTDDSSLGKTARGSQPVVRQVFVGRSDALQDIMAFERKLFVIRKIIENAIRKLGLAEDDNGTLVSLSCNTIVYKGMLMCDQVPLYYPELKDPDMETAIILVHSRFSTNTFPSWDRAHPYRYMAHNGEINTLRGNVNWMHAREAMLASDLFGEDIKKISLFV